MIKNKQPEKFKVIDLGWLLPLGGTSIGKLFGKYSVKGKIGMKLHYIMSGFRSYNLKNTIRYFILALKT